MIWLLTGFSLGLLTGRLYGHAKYRYPEFQEMINLKIAKLRAERASYEAEEERYRQEIDEILNGRMQ